MQTNTEMNNPMTDCKSKAMLIDDKTTMGVTEYPNMLKVSYNEQYLFFYRKFTNTYIRKGPKIPKPMIYPKTSLALNISKVPRRI